MSKPLNKIVGKTREWKAMEARANALPRPTTHLDTWRASLNHDVTTTLAE